ncbi:hypothetical protein EVAR_68315_1 [Eumeta japonica]|uniref:Uncharacterized protein n=1 Tax=Eumeta variegata TaxID=151549 RepID=A0A4C2AAH8_EUMVA|nr:hypothetical protein EVAR_68315_1 [Eumeta japonica]
MCVSFLILCCAVVVTSGANRKHAFNFRDKQMSTTTEVYLGGKVINMPILKCADNMLRDKLESRAAPQRSACEACNKDMSLYDFYFRNALNTCAVQYYGNPSEGRQRDIDIGGAHDGRAADR